MDIAVYTRGRAASAAGGLAAAYASHAGMMNASVGLGLVFVFFVTSAVCVTCCDSFTNRSTKFDVLSAWTQNGVDKEMIKKYM
jgi:hypothetical protein